MEVLGSELLAHRTLQGITRGTLDRPLTTIAGIDQLSLQDATRLGRLDGRQAVQRADRHRHEEKVEIEAGITHFALLNLLRAQAASQRLTRPERPLSGTLTFQQVTVCS